MSLSPEEKELQEEIENLAKTINQSSIEDFNTKNQKENVNNNQKNNNNSLEKQNINEKTNEEQLIINKTLNRATSTYKPPLPAKKSSAPPKEKSTAPIKTDPFQPSLSDFSGKEVQNFELKEGIYKDENKDKQLNENLNNNINTNNNILNNDILINPINSQETPTSRDITESWEEHSDTEDSFSMFQSTDFSKTENTLPTRSWQPSIVGSEPVIINKKTIHYFKILELSEANNADSSLQAVYRTFAQFADLHKTLEKHHAPIIKGEHAITFPKAKEFLKIDCFDQISILSTYLKTVFHALTSNNAILATFLNPAEKPIYKLVQECGQQGHMKVSKKRSISWTSKWVVFKFCRLYIYEKPEPYCEPDATILLTDSSTITKDKSDPSSFVIKNYWFKAPNEQQLTKWMTALSPWQTQGFDLKQQNRKSTGIATPQNEKNLISTSLPSPSKSTGNENEKQTVNEKETPILSPSSTPNVSNNSKILNSPQLVSKSPHLELKEKKEEPEVKQQESTDFSEDNYKFQLSLLKKISLPIIGLFILPAFLPKSFLLGTLFGIFLCLILIILLFYFLMAKSPLNKSISNQVALDFTPNLPTPLSPLQMSEETKGLKWLNMIISTFILEFFRNENFTQKFVERMNERIQLIQRPGFIGEILIEKLDFGSNVILVDDKVVMQTPAVEGELRATSSLTYSGNKPAVVLLRVEVLMNWPKENFLKLPIALTVFIEHISGPFLFVMPPGPDPILSLGFTSLPQTKFSVRSEVGNVALLKNLPKVEQFVLSKLKAFISRELLVPNGVSIHIPIPSERRLGFKLLRKVPNNPLLFGQDTSMSNANNLTEKEKQILEKKEKEEKEKKEKQEKKEKEKQDKEKKEKEKQDKNSHQISISNVQDSNPTPSEHQ